jgi:hypothetical protein
MSLFYSGQTYQNKSVVILKRKLKTKKSVDLDADCNTKENDETIIMLK